MRRLATRGIAVALAAFGTIGVSASLASATNTDPHKVTICHATASASNPYVVISVDIASIVGDSGHGHSGVNVGDIIPPIPEANYGGNNWQAGRATWANGCNVPSDPNGYPGDGQGDYPSV